MSTDTIIDYPNHKLICKAGIETLTKVLGPVGTVYFIRQFDRGGGDYTVEREKLLADVTIDELIENVQHKEQGR